MTSLSANPGYAPLVEGTRGLPDQAAHVETIHHGTICILAGDGSKIFNVGDTSLTSPLRSTAKAFQLLPFVLDGLHRSLPEGRTAEPDGSRESAPGLADLAVMMSSHNGESMHTKRIAELLRHGGLTPAALHCGTHPPLHQKTVEQLILEGRELGPLHCNCSGKHTNMLLVCAAREWALESYLDIDHPLQQKIRHIISTLGHDRNPLPHVTDGCSLPTFVVSMAVLARLFCYLALPESAPAIDGGNIAAALRLLFHAAVTYPEMIAGTGRLDTELMQAFQGRVFAKTGAAGVYAMAIKPTQRYQSGLGIAIKVADGDATSSIRRVTAFEVLRQLGVSPPSGHPDLEKLTARTLTNFRNLQVGELRAVFQLT